MLLQNEIEASEFCVFYTCKCLAAEIQLKKAIFMIHFRQLFARTNSNFIELSWKRCIIVQFKLYLELEIIRQ